MGRGRGARAFAAAVVAGVVLIALCVLGSQVASAVAGREIGWRTPRGSSFFSPSPSRPRSPRRSPASTGPPPRDLPAPSRGGPRVDAGGRRLGGAGSRGGGGHRARPGRASASRSRWSSSLAAAWYWIVRRAGRTVPPAPQERRLVGLGMFAALPPTPAGVVAARSVVYWMRDPRYVVPVLILPLVPVVVRGRVLPRRDPGRRDRLYLRPARRAARRLVGAQRRRRRRHGVLAPRRHRRRRSRGTAGAASCRPSSSARSS